MSRLVNYRCPTHGQFQHRVTCGYGNGPAPEVVRCSRCGGQAKRYRSGGRALDARRSVSLSATTYRRLRDYCDTQHLTIENLIDALTQDLGRTT